LVGKALRPDFMAWTVNFDNQSTFEADKIKDIVAQGNLPLKLCAIASPVANRAPNECLGLNALRALLARETTEYGSRDFLRHGVRLAAFFACGTSRDRAPRNPLIRRCFATTPSPARGEGRAFLSQLM